MGPHFAVPGPCVSLHISTIPDREGLRSVSIERPLIRLFSDMLIKIIGPGLDGLDMIDDISVH